MKNVNQLVVCKEDYNSYEEFENEIKNAVMLLLNAGYIMTVNYDDNDKELGVVVISYNSADDSFGDRYPYWLYPDEEESIIYRNNND